MSVANCSSIACISGSRWCLLHLFDFGLSEAANDPASPSSAICLGSPFVRPGTGPLTVVRSPQWPRRPGCRPSQRKKLSAIESTRKIMQAIKLPRMTESSRAMFCSVRSGGSGRRNRGKPGKRGRLDSQFDPERPSRLFRLNAHSTAERTDFSTDWSLSLDFCGLFTSCRRPPAALGGARRSWSEVGKVIAEHPFGLVWRLE